MKGESVREGTLQQDSGGAVRIGTVWGGPLVVRHGTATMSFLRLVGIRKLFIFLCILKTETFI